MSTRGPSGPRARFRGRQVAPAAILLAAIPVPPAVQPDEARMTIGEHLEELRRRLIVGLVALAVAFLVCWLFKEELFRLVTGPHRVAMARLGVQGPESRLAQLTYVEGFFSYCKVCLVASLVVGGPILLWQIWKFVSAGLYENERRHVTRWIPFSIVLFAAGVAFGYLLLIPTGLTYLAGVVPEGVERTFRLEPYLNLFLLLTFALGVIFQLPLFMLVLSRIGLFSPAGYRSKRKIFILLAFVGAAVATPGPDPVSQVLLAIPMIVLYEVGILLAAATYRARQTAEARAT
jgi:sec-independent protein translocase protein TatC